MMKIKKVYIDRSVQNIPRVNKICEHLQCPVNIIDDPVEIYEHIANDDDPVSRGKEILYLTRNKGAFLKSCPGTQHYLCCGYQILHIGTFCTMDCSYCILQSYFHPPLLQFFVNHENLIEELTIAFAQKNILRIGTGEFTDSMIWEYWTDLSQLLIPVFSNQNYSVLELKTKTIAIEKIKDIKHNRKTILSWSLNTEEVIRTQERKTSSLTSRLKAAAKCQKWGYPLSFHFDPMVIYPGCEKDYEIVVEKLFSLIRPENIAWISLGTFRFMPSLKPIIQKRFPDSTIVYGEFIRGMDGKMRYFKPLRIELYKTIINHIRKIAPETLVYFCMEDENVWKKSFGFVPEDYGGLSKMLDDSAQKVCYLG
jgi:spore photoproduct lyase